MDNQELCELFKKGILKEHSVYKIRVKVSKNNIEHTAFLFTGFKTGSYCYVYHNTYDCHVQAKDVYSIRNITFLTANKEE